MSFTNIDKVTTVFNEDNDIGYLLQEIGDYLLQENGDKMILQESEGFKNLTSFISGDKNVTSFSNVS